jgi:hypothetical protein
MLGSMNSAASSKSRLHMYEMHNNVKGLQEVYAEQAQPITLLRDGYLPLEVGGKATNTNGSWPAALRGQHYMRGDTT